LSLHRGTALRLLAQCLHDLGERAQALALLDTASQAQADVGDASDQALAALTASTFAGHRGDFEEQVRNARRAVQLAERHGLTTCWLRGLFAIGEGCLELGDRREGRATLERCLAIAMRARHATTMVRAATVLALEHHKDGNAAAAGWLVCIHEQPELGALDRNHVGALLDQRLPDRRSRQALRAQCGAATLETLCAEILAAPAFDG
jgi:hypothetical protein